LNAILGFSNLLREGDVSEKQRDDLDIINRSGEHLLNLINEVLDVAKIEAGRGVLEMAPCDLAGMVRDVMGMMRARAQMKNLTLHLLGTAALPGQVKADGPKLRQVLINLLGNAIKFTERGSVTLRLDAGQAAEDGRFLLNLCVEDTGIGIAGVDLATIFEAFVQAGPAATHKGSGLGLAITRQLVELMGGRIGVTSALGQGSTFRVELPVFLRQEEASAGTEAEQGRIRGLEAGQPEYRILVCEDEATSAAVLLRVLETAGFAVRVAENGARGVELFEAWHPQFIWMDLRMPVMDGLEAARRIRGMEGGQTVKIAAVSASAFAEERDAVVAAGLNDFVRKPYRVAEIFDCMARHLGVRYRRDRVRISRQQAMPAVRQEAVAALPERLREELREALAVLDEARIAGLIRRVAEFDSSLGSALSRYAERLSYTAIFQAIENCAEKGAGPIGLARGSGE
jgi:CheY-like chemotaxis protein